MTRQLITVQVYVEADPEEAETVASRAADYITESFTEEQQASVQTVIVAGEPFHPVGAYLWTGQPWDGESASASTPPAAN